MRSLCCDDGRLSTLCLVGQTAAAAAAAAVVSAVHTVCAPFRPADSSLRSTRRRILRRILGPILVFLSAAASAAGVAGTGRQSAAADSAGQHTHTDTVSIYPLLLWSRPRVSVVSAGRVAAKCATLSLTHSLSLSLTLFLSRVSTVPQ